MRPWKLRVLAVMQTFSGPSELPPHRLHDDPVTTAMVTTSTQMMPQNE